MKRGLVLSLLAVALAACSTADSSPLIFGQGVTVGISVGTSAANANTPEITIGVKMADIAVVPTVIPKDHPGATRDEPRIHAFGEGDKATTDALSTFGSFNNETKVDKVTLGIFFATGVAAQNLSNGFKCALGKSHKDCSTTTNETTETPAPSGGSGS